MKIRYESKLLEILDGIVDNVWNPDFKIPSNSTVYAIVRDVDTTLYGNERVDISLKILKYLNISFKTDISDMSVVDTSCVS